MQTTLKFERNIHKEGTFQKGEKKEWWSCHTALFGLHVYQQDDVWKYKVNSITSWVSVNSFESRVLAQVACVESVKRKITEIMEGLIA